MSRRRVGRSAARGLAAGPTLATALSALVQTPYGHDVRQGQTLAEAQRAVVDTVVWNLRVLAGWAPRAGVTILRVLLAGLEISNVEVQLHRFAGEESPPPYRLGGLATAWPRLAGTTSIDEVRGVLATSWWGDPGGGMARDIGLAMRASLADRTVAAVPAAGMWAGGATALLVARTLVLERRDLPAASRLAVSRVVGPAALSATTLPELVAVLPASARWALAEVRDPDDLWQAEARWWARVERDGFDLGRRVLAGPEVLVAAVALLAVDAWRVRAALEVAARGGGPVEVFDAVA
jgi:hypothetical protein